MPNEALHHVAAALGAQGALVPLASGMARTFRAETPEGPRFVKLVAAADADRLAAEADGLAALAAHRALRTPAVVAAGTVEGGAFLALEWLAFARADAAAERRLGEGLAALHALRQPRFGHRRDNFIGRTPQANGGADDAVAFLRERRLAPMLAGAAEHGASARLRDAGAKLLERLPAFYRGYAPTPSPLHGDLWGGNWGALAGGEPVIFDPAYHAGDRESELAMTELFGGFGAAFRAAYEHALPLDAGYATRRGLHQLYHVLNHFVLFGGGYGAEAERLVARLLAVT